MKYLLLTSTSAIATAAFMSDVLETVIVHGDNGPMRINKSDYDKAIAEDDKAYKLYTPKKNDDFGVEGITQNTVIPAPAGMTVPPAPSTPPMLLDDQPEKTLQLMPGNPPVPSPAGSTIPQTETVQNNQRLVMPIGTGKNKAYFIVNSAGEKIVADDIDPNGYPTEQDAWKAAVPALGGNPAPTADKPA